MSGLSEHDVFIFVAELGIIIFTARLFGEIARRLGQPVIAGEVIAGIFLGPTIFGKLAPGLHKTIFPTVGAHTVLIQGISWLCVVFLLLITGLEIDFWASISRVKKSIFTSLLGILMPFVAILVISYILPAQFFFENINRTHVHLLLATALSVVAIDVVAKILFDLKILRSFVGVNIITAGILSDIFGWTILAIIIYLVNYGSISFWGVAKPLLIMAGYLGFTLTIGRIIVDKLLEWIHVRVQDAATVLALLFSLALLNGAIAHLLGLHVIFGAFIAGLMAGESKKITPYMRESIQDHIFGIYTPLFFALIGMQLRFGAGLYWWGYVLLMLVIVMSFKVLGAYLGTLGRLGKKNAFAVSCGLNTQGTMGIVVGLVGVDLGLFNSELFTAIVFISITSALFVGPCLQWAMKRVRRPLAKYFDREHVFLDVGGSTKKEVVSEMTRLMHGRKIINDPELILKEIWAREETMSTAIGEGVALPHARLENFQQPVLCFFRLKKPIDYSSPDDKPVQLLFLELTDAHDDGMQLNLIAQISRFLSKEGNRHKLINARQEEDIHHFLSLDEQA